MADETFSDVVNRLRKERRLSHAELYEGIGVSKSRWYRALEGGAELTIAEGQKLARLLGVELSELGAAGGQWEPVPDPADEGRPVSPAGQELEDFASNMDRIVRMLSSGNGEPLSQKAKIAILNGIEEASRMAGSPLPIEFYDIRRRVNEGKL